MENVNNIINNKILEEIICLELCKLGIKPILKGYRCLIEAIKIKLINPKKVEKFTTQLYPYLSNKLNLSVMAVERDIRTAINVAYKNDKKRFEILCLENHKPTNVMFIKKMLTVVKSKYEEQPNYRL